MCGRDIATALTLIPLLYAICTRAQAAAARHAIAAAQGSHADAAADGVDEEVARELLFAVLTGSAQSGLRAALACRGDRTALRALFATALLGMPPAQWLKLDGAAALGHWAHTSRAPLALEAARRLAQMEPQTTYVALLPPWDAEETLSLWPRLTGPFSAAPDWRGAAAETGPRARQNGHPLTRDLESRPILQRWIARLIELLRYACADPELSVGRVSAATTARGAGRAIVEVARGTLMHEVRLDGNRIAEYVVVAPTEWNFHPGCALPRWLQSAPVASAYDAVEFARRCVAALDPCVECRWSIR